MSIGENIRAIRSELDAVRAGITLVGVSKFHSADEIREAMAAGLTLFGENRAQELRDKAQEINNCTWHFIGQLQLNKVKYVVGTAALIQSVDRQELAGAINERAAALGIRQDCLIEVNLTQDEHRGGVRREELEPLARFMCAQPCLSLKGLMCVLPVEGDADSWFSYMRGLYEDMACRYKGMDCLSMGMTHDYMSAVRHGATMVRIGSGIFGERKIR